MLMIEITESAEGIMLMKKYPTSSPSSADVPQVYLTDTANEKRMRLLAEELQKREQPIKNPLTWSIYGAIMEKNWRGIGEDGGENGQQKRGWILYGSTSYR
jgi:hypothetical protein